MSNDVKHPAVMSPQIMAACKLFLPDRRCKILDPFAGLGTTATLLPEHDVVGIEIEEEWSDCHPSTVCGDAKDVIPTLGKFDAVLTSPTYGNRMADDFEAKDSSKRITYRHKLGRKLSEGTSSNLYFGKKNKKYENFHKDIWYLCIEALNSGGVFILNCKDFIALGEVKKVTQWHVDCLTEMGMNFNEAVKVPSRGMKYGANHNVRVDYENVVCLTKP